MSETARFQPGADEEWDTIDEAVRGQYDEVLTKGASLLDGECLSASDQDGQLAFTIHLFEDDELLVLELADDDLMQLDLDGHVRSLSLLRADCQLAYCL